MSRHSKWAKIKREKGANDVKKSAVFTKLGNAITVAARNGGGDTGTNLALRLAIEKAKEENLPRANIERAIKKGIGEEGLSELENISYEAISKNGITLIIDCITDNRNRSVSQLKNLFTTSGFTLSKGGVLWQFNEVGLIGLRPLRKVEQKEFGKGEKFEKVKSEEVELRLMDVEGVTDVDITNDEVGEEIIEVITVRGKLVSVLKMLEKDQYKILGAEIAKLPKSTISLDKEEQTSFEEFIEKLEEFSDVNKVWHNVNLK